MDHSDHHIDFGGYSTIQLGMQEYLKVYFSKRTKPTDLHSVQILAKGAQTDNQYDVWTELPISLHTNEL